MSRQSGKSLKKLLVNNRESGLKLSNAASKTFFEKMLSETMNVYRDVILTEKEASELNQTLFLMKYGSGVFNPIICQGASCPFGKICTLQKSGKPPLGERCPLEMATIMTRAQYWSNVLSQNDCDLENTLYEHYINKLVYIDLMIQRCSWSEACDYPHIVIEMISKVGKFGEIEKQLVENPLVNVSEKLLKLQASMLQELILTPKEIYRRNVALKVKQEVSDFAALQMKKRLALKESRERMEEEDRPLELPDHIK